MKALGFSTIYLVISSSVFMNMYQKSLEVHPYITGLAVFMGYIAFDFKGIIYGPLLVCLAFIIYDQTKNYGNDYKTYIKKETSKIFE